MRQVLEALKTAMVEVGSGSSRQEPKLQKRKVNPLMSSVAKNLKSFTMMETSLRGTTMTSISIIRTSQVATRRPNRAQLEREMSLD